MDRRTLAIALIVAVVVVCVISTVFYSSLGGGSVNEGIKDEVMRYVKSRHPETDLFMKDLSWSGGRVASPRLVGAETYEYAAKGWIVTIKYPVVPNLEYSITVDYSASRLQGYVGIPYRIIWKGTYPSGVITETSYAFAQ